MTSEVFALNLSGSHVLEISDSIAGPFINKGHKRVKVIAKFENQEISFHGALQKRNG